MSEDTSIFQEGQATTKPAESDAAPKESEQQELKLEGDKSNEEVSEEQAPEVKEDEAKDESRDSDDAESDGDDGPPEKYDLKIPEGSDLSERVLERTAEQARELGLSQKQAQRLVDLKAEAFKEHQGIQDEDHKQRVEGWKEELLKDKEFGGDNFKKNAELAKRVIQKYGDEDFIKTLTESGMGNHPGLVKFVWRIAKSSDQAAYVKPGAQAKQEKSIEEIFYPEARN